MISLAKEYRRAEKNTPLVGFSNAKHTDRRNLKAIYLIRISLPILLRTETLYIARRLLLTRNSLASSRPRIQPMTLMFSSTRPFGSLSKRDLSQTRSPLAELRPLLILKTRSLDHQSPAICLVRRFALYSLVTLLPFSSCLQSSAPSTPVATGSTPAPTSAAPTEIIGNFGSCSVPQIEFGAGFDNRKETSFEPIDKSETCGCIRNAASR